MTCIRREDDAEHSSTASAAAQPGRSDAQQPPQFENSPLPAAMLAVANDDTDANRRALYESMFASWFLVPTRNTPSPGAPGFHELQEDMADSFMLENDSAGQVVAVAFTDEEALRNWNKNIPWIALKGTDFF